MKKRKILIIDETIREGMQYRGLMFSCEQRLTIIKFQEELKVDICQAGYPPAHDAEADMMQRLFDHSKNNNYKIRIAAMGRANHHDAQILLNTRVNDLHFHIHIKNDVKKDGLESILSRLSDTIHFVRTQNPDAGISIAMLDIGKSSDSTLEHCVSFLGSHPIDMLSLPDTSGMMAPNQVFEKINQLSSLAGKTGISIHCHNDMGLAVGNSVMGILAGGNILEASVLGIGERNGIADLYTTVRMLKEQGFDIHLDTDNITTFKAYYDYVDRIVYEQTGNHLLTVNTPVFGDAVRTHVGGTHADGSYGLASEERFFLNVLCGRHLVKKYLDHHDLYCPEDRLDILTLKIKSKSIHHNRSLSKTDIVNLISSLPD